MRLIQINPNSTLFFYGFIIFSLKLYFKNSPITSDLIYKSSYNVSVHMSFMRGAKDGVGDEGELDDKWVKSLKV